MRVPICLTALVIGGIAVLTGCGSGSGASSGASATTLAGTAWELATYAGANGATAAAVTGVSAPLEFPTTREFAGSTGCNRFAGTYAQNGASVTLAVGPTTLVGCSAALASQDSDVRRLLDQVTRAGINAGTLTLSGSRGTPLLTYVAGLTGIEGTSWTATGVNNGAEAVVGTALTDHLTGSFGPGGAFSGSGGCNTLAGTYTTSGAHDIRIGDLTTSFTSCAADVATLEHQYVAALENARVYEISGDTLTLRDGAGAIQVTYRLAG